MSNIGTICCFCKKIHFRCLTGSEFASDYNKSIFFTNDKRAISRLLGTVTLLPNRDFTCSTSTIETLKTLEEDVKFV